MHNVCCFNMITAQANKQSGQVAISGMEDINCKVNMPKVSFGFMMKNALEACPCTQR